jgi:hypothetical protein
LTVYSLESRAGFVSHRQRSWDSPFGGLSLSSRSCRRLHRKRTRVPLVRLDFRHRSDGPVRRTAVSRSIPAESARRGTERFKPTLASASLGFCPFRACCEDLGQDFSKPPLTHFAKPWRLLAEFAGASEYQSAFTPPCPTTRRNASPAKATLVGFLHLPAPEH